MSKGICCSPLQEKAGALRVRVRDFNNSCFFCRKCGEEFGFQELVPEGVCPDLFFQIYPQYLSLLYNGEPGANEGLIACPGTRGKTYWRIKAEKFWLSPLINTAYIILRAFCRYKDAFDSKVTIELIRTEGFCPRGYAGKTEISFNQYSHIWGRRFFCPAVFYTLYPFLVSLEGRGQVRLQCPADYTSVVFEIIEGNKI